MPQSKQILTRERIIAIFGYAFPWLSDERVPLLLEQQDAETTRYWKKRLRMALAKLEEEEEADREE